MVPDRRPFCSTDDADVFDREDGEEQVFVGSVVPVLIHDERGMGGLNLSAQRTIIAVKTLWGWLSRFQMETDRKLLEELDTERFK